MSRQAADRAYLEGLIDGTGDLLAEDTFTKLEPMFARYEANADMTALLEQAATVYGDAAVDAAYWFIAGGLIEEAKKRANDI